MSASKRNGRDHKSQHWVSVFYLKAWCQRTVATREPFLWRFDSDGSNPKAKSPKKVFQCSDLYTLLRRDGTRVLAWEQALGKVESEFAPVLQDKVLPMLPLTARDVVAVMGFIAAQLVRTPAFRDHWAEQMGELVSLGEQMERAFKEAPPERRRAMSRSLSSGGPSMNLYQARAARDHPLLLVGPPMMHTLMQIFGRMHMVILCTDDEVGFITSDQPAAIYDPQAYKRPPIFRAPGLGSRTTEVTMPLAPNRLALLTHLRVLPGYTMIPPDDTFFLDEYNRRTRFHCDKHFVVNQKVTKPIWFDPGVPPPDAWKPDDSDGGDAEDDELPEDVPA